MPTISSTGTSVATAPRRWHRGHWLGTDRLGRDLLVRTLHGVRVSLLDRIAGDAREPGDRRGVGCVAGYLGGRTDELMMRFVDVLYALPYIFIVIILTTVFERGNLYVLFVAIGAVGWLTMARIVRGQTLSLQAARVRRGGGRDGRGHAAAIIARHIVPNLIGPVVAYATLTIPQMILYESFLSFLGPRRAGAAGQSRAISSIRARASWNRRPGCCSCRRACW